MIRVVIIEDEINSRELLEQMLVEYCKEVEFVGSAIDVKSGVELINLKKPDLVFLDVEMPGGTGFDILDAFETPDFKVIFVTGYDHYAIKAIKYSALDYLLKPIDLKELRGAVENAKRKVIDYQKSIEFFKEQIKKPDSENLQIIVSDSRIHQIIKVREIVFIEAEGSYITFHLDDNEKCITTNPLHSYEDLLPERYFFRIHKSYIVNCEKVIKLETGRGGSVHLNNGKALSVAFRRKPAFSRFLENFV